MILTLTPNPSIDRTVNSRHLVFPTARLAWPLGTPRRFSSPAMRAAFQPSYTNQPKMRRTAAIRA